MSRQTRPSFRPSQVLKHCCRKWKLLPNYQQRKQETIAAANEAFQRLLKARSVRWWKQYQLQRLEGRRMKQEALGFRRRALFRRTRLAYAEYEEYKKVAAVRKAERALLIARFRTSTGKRKVIKGFRCAVEYRQKKGQMLVKAAEFADARCLIRVLTQWGHHVGQAQVEREQSRLAERHRRLATLRRGFRVWSSARTQRVLQQGRRQAAHEMGRRRVLRRVLRAWHGWLAVRGDSEEWDKRHEEMYLRAACRVSRRQGTPVLGSAVSVLGIIPCRTPSLITVQGIIMFLHLTFISSRFLFPEESYLTISVT